MTRNILGHCMSTIVAKAWMATLISCIMPPGHYYWMWAACLALWMSLTFPCWCCSSFFVQVPKFLQGLFKLFKKMTRNSCSLSGRMWTVLYSQHHIECTKLAEEKCWNYSLSQVSSFVRPSQLLAREREGYKVHSPSQEDGERQVNLECDSGFLVNKLAMVVVRCSLNH